jgi:beta-lactam-binding protein with PASTA domain
MNLVISSGPQMVAVPNVEGLIQDDAATALTVATAKVISQDPASGSLAQGSSVVPV